MTTDNEKYVDYLDFSTSTWKRPEAPKKIWRIIDGRRKTADGNIPRFSIQEVPEELKEDVVDFMVKHFIPNEPSSVAMGLGGDPVAVREMRTMWRDTLRFGLSVVALTVNSDPSMKPVIAGVNILGVVTAEDVAKAGEHPKPFRSLIMRTYTGIAHKLIKEANVLKKYGVDEYLTGCCLSVDLFFKGQGIGEELLRIRNEIGMAYKIPVSQTIFSSNESQFLAYRVGFEVLVERKYTELFDEEGNMAFPGIKVEFLTIMGKRLY